MVRLKKNRRYCSCGKRIQDDKNTCDVCEEAYRKLRSKDSDVVASISDFIQFVKYKCGYTNKLPKRYNDE